MGVQPPYLYDAVKTEGPGSPYREFDPKAVTRASYTPKPPRPKHDGPLVSFNQHPDSFLILPYGNSTATPMNASVKTWIKWMRIIQLTARVLELFAGLGLLVLMILINGVDPSTGWVMRIVPGIAILHTVYGIYHLGRKPSGRTPGSSSSYHLFASFFDVSIAAFYAFSAFVAKTGNANWGTILSGNASSPSQDLITIFIKVVFLLGAVGGGLHLLSLAISLYLAVTFRKITKLPPDMNPLEDNLTTRHKRNKSSVSTLGASTISEKRISLPLESKRASGAVYEDLNRPPSIPFFHTRTQSTTSFSTYKSTPPPSRDSRLDLPSRQYQAVPSNIHSPRSSMIDLSPKRQQTPFAPNINTPPKRASYHNTPLSDTSSLHSTNTKQVGNVNEAWFTADSLSKARTRSSPAKKAQYQPIHHRHDSEENVSLDAATEYGSSYDPHPNPLEANPPTPRHAPFPGRVDSPLSELSNNNSYGRDVVRESRNNNRKSYNRTPAPSGDITDMTRDEPQSQTDVFKAKFYGELKPGTPPLIVGTANGRQVSSGNDYAGKGTFRVRDVSGKVAEEGRGGNAGRGWGTRFRKVSGL